MDKEREIVGKRKAQLPHKTINLSHTTYRRKDIEEMDKEREIVGKRIERMQRKVEGMPSLDLMLEVARKLRVEKEREKELQVSHTNLLFRNKRFVFPFTQS